MTLRDEISPPDRERLCVAATTRSTRPRTGCPNITGRNALASVVYRFGSWRGSVETEHREESGVDLPLLIDRDAVHLIPETGDVDSAELLDEDSRGFTGDVDLGSERCRPSAR
jgi:hypothetical protein